MLELVGTKAAMSEKISFNVRLASLNSSESVFRGGVFFIQKKCQHLFWCFGCPKITEFHDIQDLIIYFLSISCVWLDMLVFVESLPAATN